MGRRRWGVDAGSSAVQPKLVEPMVFWTDDGLLCGPSERPGTFDCHDPIRGIQPVKRFRPAAVKPLQLSQSVGSATFLRDGTIRGDETKVGKLRCARSPFLDRSEYRYLPGPGGRLAVLVLEEDDVREQCARLDAQCEAGYGRRFWRVLVNIAACPAP